MAPKRRASRQRVASDDEYVEAVEGEEGVPGLVVPMGPTGLGISGQEAFHALDTADAGSDIAGALERLKLFLVTAPSAWAQGQAIKRLRLPTKETIACVLWNNLYHITGTDIVKALQFRFAAFGRPVKPHLHKKFEEGVFSDLRNLKPGVDATLEEPRSPLLDFLFKSNCIRTQKKQKVFYWFSVPHDRLFLDALERDLKRESQGLEPTTVPSATSAEMTLSLAKQQCLPTFAVQDGSASATPQVFSRQGSVHSGLGDHHQQQYNNAQAVAIEQELLNQAYAVASVSNSPFMEPLNPFPTPHQNGRLSPLTMTHHYVPPGSQQSQQLSPESPSKRQRLLEVPISRSASPQQQSLQITAPMSLLEGSPNYKQRSRARVQAYPNLQHPAPNNPDAFRVASSSADRNFACTAPGCSQTFKRFEHLRRHFRLHTGEKPYVCHVAHCEKAFARVDGLGSHLKTHGLAATEISAAMRRQQEAAGDSSGGEEDDGHQNQSGDVSGNVTGNVLGGSVDVPELAPPGESPMTMLTPLSMMAANNAMAAMMNAQAAAGMPPHMAGYNMYQNPTSEFQQQMVQLSAQADMMNQQHHHQQHQQGQVHQQFMAPGQQHMMSGGGGQGEEFSTFFNIGDDNSATGLQNASASSAFLQDPSKQEFFNFQVPGHQGMPGHAMQFSMGNMQAVHNQRFS